MSEEKTYVVKNDAGGFLNQEAYHGSFNWVDNGGVAFSTKKEAEK